MKQTPAGIRDMHEFVQQATGSTDKFCFVLEAARIDTTLYGLCFDPLGAQNFMPLVLYWY